MVFQFGLLIKTKLVESEYQSLKDRPKSSLDGIRVIHLRIDFLIAILPF